MHGASFLGDLYAGVALQLLAVQHVLGGTDHNTWSWRGRSFQWLLPGVDLSAQCAAAPAGLG